jgi:hypothetical protein
MLTCSSITDKSSPFASLEPTPSPLSLQTLERTFPPSRPSSITYFSCLSIHHTPSIATASRNMSTSSELTAGNTLFYRSWTSRVIISLSWPIDVSHKVVFCARTNFKLMSRTHRYNHSFSTIAQLLVHYLRGDRFFPFPPRPLQDPTDPWYPHLLCWYGYIAVL